MPLPTGRGWWVVAAGIAAGVIVFLLLWLGQRGGEGLHRSDEQPPAATGPAFAPLPAPSTSGMARSTDDRPLRDTGARIDEPSGASRASDPTSGPAPAVGGSSQGEMAGASAIDASTSTPVPIESPSPRYPARALRRGESGEVLLRVHVDARGVPSEVEVASSSGSKDLDRAARSSVRRWRFRPAMRNGRPVPGVVNIPVTFDSGR